MSELKNGNPRHKLTKEEMSRGGKASTLAKKLGKRKKCSENCPIFDRCPLAGVGLKYGVCFLNKDHPVLRKNVLKLLNGEEQDFFDIVSTIISDMMRVIETEDDSNVKTKKVVVDALKDFYTMKFGSKEKIEHSGKIDISILKKYLEQENE